MIGPLISWACAFDQSRMYAVSREPNWHPLLRLVAIEFKKDRQLNAYFLRERKGAVSLSAYSQNVARMFARRLTCGHTRLMKSIGVDGPFRVSPFGVFRFSSRLDRASVLARRKRHGFG
jgi:hypothetical protein